MKIRLLDPSVSNKIAAGEVVERPASIVKELVENSIDAHADSITVELKGGGIEYIRISDNGCGMEEDDVKQAFLRHATSKITSAADLNNILTLGFRGEALASIAAVSKIELVTRTKDALQGTQIELEGGNIQKFCCAGCPEGTAIKVRDLFFNTPVRRKFLKKTSQESAYVFETVIRLALSNPQISLRYIQDGKTLIHTPGDNNLISAIRAVFGTHTAQNMIEINKQGEIGVYGFIGNREIQRSNKSRQFIFINGRCVKNETIQKAVCDAYLGRLNVGKFPFFVLNISLDGSKVDVNVHPTKQEVRFSDSLNIYDCIYSCVENTLRENQEIPSLFPSEKRGFSNTVSQISSMKQSGENEINTQGDSRVFVQNNAQNLNIGANAQAGNGLAEGAHADIMQAENGQHTNVQSQNVQGESVQQANYQTENVQDKSAQHANTQAENEQEGNTQNGSFEKKYLKNKNDVFEFASFVASSTPKVAQSSFSFNFTPRQDSNVFYGAHNENGAILGSEEKIVESRHSSTDAADAASPSGTAESSLNSDACITANTLLTQMQNSAALGEKGARAANDLGEKHAGVSGNSAALGEQTSGTAGGSDTLGEQTSGIAGGSNTLGEQTFGTAGGSAVLGEQMRLHDDGISISECGADAMIPENSDDFKVCGILFDTYIILQAHDDCFIIDQHAAHERLLFEKFFAAAEAGENLSQLRLIPEIISLTPNECAVLEEYLPPLVSLGFEIENIGANAYAVKATPIALEDIDVSSFIEDILSENTSIRMVRNSELKRSKLMQLACKSAVKGGDKLTNSDISKLMQLIIKEGIPLSCPHGRPILVRLSKHELEVRFKRIQ